MKRPVYNFVYVQPAPVFHDRKPNFISCLKNVSAKKHFFAGIK